MFGGGGFVDTVPAPADVQTYDDATKAGSMGAHAPDLVFESGIRKRNGVTVPHGARWVWLRASDERPDLQGEIVDAETIRRFRDYIISQAGWLDLNHWSRPQKFPPTLAAAGRSPEEYVIGAITDLRVSPDGTTYIEGFLWPKGVNSHADTVWEWLRLAPEKVHASVGGPAISRERERLPTGAYVTRLRLLMNHCAICNQGVHVDTEVRTAPFGEFTKALIDGVSDGLLGVVAEFVRGPAVREVAKDVAAAGGADGINAQGAVPEDLEGAAKPETIKDTGAASPQSGLADGPINCGHFRAGQLPSDAHAFAHMTQCLGWSATRARDTLRLARHEPSHQEAAA